MLPSVSPSSFICRISRGEIAKPFGAVTWARTLGSRTKVFLRECCRCWRRDMSPVDWSPRLLPISCSNGNTPKPSKRMDYCGGESSMDGCVDRQRAFTESCEVLEPSPNQRPSHLASSAAKSERTHLPALYFTYTAVHTAAYDMISYMQALVFNCCVTRA